ncbi:(ABC) transporter, partial [Perkinsus olseni]
MLLQRIHAVDENIRLAAFGAIRYAVKEPSPISLPIAAGGLGVMTGIVFLSIFFTYALVFWYGGKLIYDGTNNPSTGEPYNGGNVITVYFACIMATFALGQIAPNISFFIEGKTAGAKIFPLFEVRDDPSRIEPPLSEGPRDSGSRPTMSSIAFRKVTFSYPARPEVEVLSDVSFTINAGEK